MGIKLDPIDTEVNHFYRWKANSAGLGLASKAMGAATLGDRDLCFPHLIDKGGGTGLPVADGDGAAQVEAGELQIYELTGGRDGLRIAGET